MGNPSEEEVGHHAGGDGDIRRLSQGRHVKVLGTLDRDRQVRESPVRPELPPLNVVGSHTQSQARWRRGQGWPILDQVFDYRVCVGLKAVGVYVETCGTRLLFRVLARRTAMMGHPDLQNPGREAPYFYQRTPELAEASLEWAEGSCNLAGMRQRVLVGAGRVTTSPRRSAGRWFQEVLVPPGGFEAACVPVPPFPMSFGSAVRPALRPASLQALLTRPFQPAFQISRQH